MNLDSYYLDIDKNNFYLGMISQINRNNVTLQVENLSLFNNRKIRSEILVPNTINFFVIVDSVQGLFIGEVYQTKVLGSDSLHNFRGEEGKENIFPEMNIDILGILKNGDKFELPGFETVGITDKVYVANKGLIDKYLMSIEIHNYDKQVPLQRLAKIGNFHNEYLSLQANTLFDRHLMAIGTTNSGKSTSALSILDKMINSNKKILLIDPTGEYRDSFEGKEIDKLILGDNATIPIGKVSMTQWENIFETNENTQGAILSKAISSLRVQEKNKSTSVLVKDKQSVKDIEEKIASLESVDTEFNLSNLPAQIHEEAVEVDKKGEKYTSNSFHINTNNWLLEKVQYVLENSMFENFFSSNEDTDLLKKIDSFLSDDGSSMYIDASKIGISDNIGAMIIDLICNYIINKDEIETAFVMYIDEVHRYFNNSHKYQRGLTAIAREGRKKGIFLFLTTQNPKDVPEILLGQFGTLIIHRVTNSEELQAIQNQVNKNTIFQVKNLNQGEAIIASINLIQDIHVKFIESDRKHSNNTPIL